MVLAFVIVSMMSASFRPDVLTIPPETNTPQPYEVVDLENIALYDAAEYGLNSEHFLKVINCESGFSATSTSATDDFGIAQINVKAHPDITKDEMFNPIWSLDWMAQQWSIGNAKMWVCYNKIYG